jgi:hypothetical protein
MANTQHAVVLATCACSSYFKRSSSTAAITPSSASSSCCSASIRIVTAADRSAKRHITKKIEAAKEVEAAAEIWVSLRETAEGG